MPKEKQVHRISFSIYEHDNDSIYGPVPAYSFRIFTVNYCLLPFLLHNVIININHNSLCRS